MEFRSARPLPNSSSLAANHFLNGRKRRRRVHAVGGDHPSSPGQAQHPETLAKKSLSSLSCPILACNFLIWSSRETLSFSALLEKISVSPSSACFFHCAPKCVASWASVSSPYMAALATFALNCAESRVRLPIPGAPPRSSAFLAHLSELWGPPLAGAGR
jgi:hypothetical protein